MTESTQRESVATVLAVAGGTGGHRYPAEAFLTALAALKPKWNLGLVVDARAMRYSEPPFPLYPLCAWNPSGWRGFVSPGKWRDFAAAFGDARRLIDDRKPDLLVGFGSYASVPPLLIGAASGVTTLIHEQNAIWGLANGLLRHWVTRAAVAIPSNKLVCEKRISVVGMPVRSRLKRIDAGEARRELGLDPKKQTLLVTGGSQGALAINRVFEDFVREQAGRLPGWQFLHLCGKRAGATAQAPVAGVVRIEFLKEMHLAYSASDAVLSRAGSSSLHEIAFYRKPALLVPYPFARAHQVANARFVEAKRGAKVILESAFDAQILADWLMEFERDPQKMRKMGEAAGSALDASGAERLAELAVRMLESHKRKRA